MELPSRVLEQRAFNTRPKREEQMLIVMKKSSHEKHLSQPLQTKNKQYKIAVTFLNCYIGIFNVTNKNLEFFFISVIEGAEYNIIIPQGAYEKESLNAEFKRNVTDEGCITEEDYPFTIKPAFSRLGSIVEIALGRKRQIRFVRNGTLRDLIGFEPSVLHEKYKLSDKPVDKLSFDKIFLETVIAQGMIS